MKVRFLTAEEEEKLAEAAPDLRPIILAGIYAGLRIRAEALTLKWENVDLERRFITIEATYSKNREVQTIPIHSKLLAALKELFVVRRGEHVFAKADGNWHKSIRTAFTNACQRATLTGVAPHLAPYVCIQAGNGRRQRCDSANAGTMERAKDDSTLRACLSRAPCRGGRKNWLPFPYGIHYTQSSILVSY